jgi:polysaccharide deacetylase family protein (PEP-CTERM system associated)
MSIDVEDWFQVENLKGVVPRDSWDTQPSRVVANTDRMLALMRERRIRCTCFILGWVADKHPDLIRRIAADGHEIACHGYGHDLVYSLSHEQFRQDITRATRLIEDLTGAKVRGYRAPSFSITDWAIDILQELGYAYDSSAFPTVAHDRYGKLAGMKAGVPIIQIRPGFYEVCISCVQLGAKGVPWGGGGYFRLFPYPLFKWGVKKILASGMPYVFYIHPWEIDPGQPRVPGLKKSHAFRHYVSLDRCEHRWATLLSDFSWRPIWDLIEAWKAAPADTPARRAQSVSDGSA